MASLYLNVLASGVLIGIVYALIAIGLTIMFGVMRMVNFAHGEFVVVGMYTGYLLWSFFGIAPVLAMPIAAMFLFILGYVLQARIINAFIQRPQHVQFILFIGFSLIATGADLMIFGPDPRSINSPTSFEVLALGDLRLDMSRLQAASGALVIIASLLFFLRCTRIGASIRAAADNNVGARAIGLRVSKVYAVTTGIAMACAGAAGALTAPIFNVQPYLAPEFTMIAFSIVILGGLGSLAGALISGILIGVTESFAALLLNPELKSMVWNALLVAMLIVRPQGLMGGGKR